MTSLSPPSTALATSRDPLAALARRLGCSHGQAYTLVGGLALALILGAGLPGPVTGGSGRLPAAPLAAAAPPAGAAVPEPPAAPQAVSPITGEPLPPAPLPQGVLLPAPAADAPRDAAPANESPGPPPGRTPEPATGPAALLHRLASEGSPRAVAATPDGVVYVAVEPAGDGPSRLLRFDRTGRRATAFVVAGQPAARSSGVSALAFAGGSLHLTDESTSRVLRLDATSGRSSVLATIPDVAPCLLVVSAPSCEPGVVDREPALRGVAVDRSGTVYVSDAGQGIVWRLAPAGPEAFVSSAELATGDGPAGLVVDADGALQFVAAQTLRAQDPGTGGLFRVRVEGDDAGPLERVASFPDGAGATGLAVGADGRRLVSLSVADAVVVVPAAGGSATPLQAAAASPLPLDAPAGLVLAGPRLLVANSARGSERSRWAVLSFTTS